MIRVRKREEWRQRSAESVGQRDGTRREHMSRGESRAEHGRVEHRRPMQRKEGMRGDDKIRGTR